MSRFICFLLGACCLPFQSGGTEEAATSELPTLPITWKGRPGKVHLFQPGGELLIVRVKSAERWADGAWSTVDGVPYVRDTAKAVDRLYATGKEAMGWFATDGSWTEIVGPAALDGRSVDNLTLHSGALVVWPVPKVGEESLTIWQWENDAWSPAPGAPIHRALCGASTGSALVFVGQATRTTEFSADAVAVFKDRTWAPGPAIPDTDAVPRTCTSASDGIYVTTTKDSGYGVWWVSETTAEVVALDGLTDPQVIPGEPPVLMDESGFWTLSGSSATLLPAVEARSSASGLRASEGVWVVGGVDSAGEPVPRVELVPVSGP